MPITKPCGTVEITGTCRKVILPVTMGNTGWSPVLSLVSDGNRRVLRLISWVGGSGTPPVSGNYIGLSGLVSSITEAVDVRGEEGLSAYEVAIENGFIGTEEEWLDSLKPQWIITDW